MIFLALKVLKTTRAFRALLGRGGLPLFLWLDFLYKFVAPWIFFAWWFSTYFCYLYAPANFELKFHSILTPAHVYAPCKSNKDHSNEIVYPGVVDEINPYYRIIWSNYSDLTRPHPKWWFSKGFNHVQTNWNVANDEANEIWPVQQTSLSMLAVDYFFFHCHGDFV